MGKGDALTVGTLSLAFFALLPPLGGMLSDRIGRKPLLLGFSLGFAVLVVPLLHLVTDTFASLLLEVAGRERGNGVKGTRFEEREHRKAPPLPGRGGAAPWGCGLSDEPTHEVEDVGQESGEDVHRDLLLEVVGLNSPAQQGVWAGGVVTVCSPPLAPRHHRPLQ